MKKKYLIKQILILILCSYFSTSAVTNKAFFMPRAIGQDAVLQNISDLYIIDRKEAESKTKPMFNLTNIFFYDESTNKSDLARYLSPNNKTELTVKGYAVAGEKDIAAEWLRIVSDGDRQNANEYLFSSKISIHPKQTRFGDIIKLHKRLDFIHKKLWLQAYFPIIQVETNVNLKEYDKQHERASGSDDAEDYPEPHNAVQALSSLLIQYEKVTDQNQKIAGLADIDLKLGFKIFKQLSLYLKGVLPTSYKPKAEYLFEPILGNGGHWGIGTGLNLNLKFLKHFNFLSNLDYVYLFKNNEKRSFDLKENGPWSRYLDITNQHVQTRPIPLINFVTRDLDITPGSVVNWVGSFHANYKSFNAEIGYNFWYREKEHASLKNNWDENIGIAWFEKDNPNTFFNSYQSTHINPSVKISENMILEANPTKFEIIKASNLNIDSVAHPESMSHKIYLALGCDAKWHNSLSLLNIGTSYEFADNNKALELWSIWGQLSLYF